MWQLWILTMVLVESKQRMPMLFGALRSVCILFCTAHVKFQGLVPDYDSSTMCVTGQIGPHPFRAVSNCKPTGLLALNPAQREHHNRLRIRAVSLGMSQAGRRQVPNPHMQQVRAAALPTESLG
jgi:hypothetical protein